MALQAESALSRRIRAALNARGHRVWKNHGSRLSERGLSDLSGMTREGRGVVLEVKMPGKLATLRPEQARFLASVVKASPLSVVGVVTSVQEAISACEEMRFAHVTKDGGVFMVGVETLPADQWTLFCRAIDAMRRASKTWITPERGFVLNKT